MKEFRTIAAFFQALIPFIGFGAIAFVIYLGVPSPFNIIIVVFILILGLLSSRMIFNMMRRRGVIATLAGSHASYDLDELEPAPGSNVSKISPIELTKLFHEKKLTFSNGITVSIWGDWEGRKLNTRHHLEAVNYDVDNKVLTIKLDDNCILKVKEPRLIHLTGSYLKIIKAKEIQWKIPNDSDANDQYSYVNTDGKIKTSTNTQWKPHSYDIGIGMNALYLQG